MSASHRLTVWRKADLLTQRLCSSLPNDAAAPHSDLVNRLRRVATEIPLAIDAGSRSQTADGFAAGVERAIELTHETEYLLSLLEALGRLAATECARLLARTDQVQRMLAGLLRTIEQGGRQARATTPRLAPNLKPRRRPRPSPALAD